MPSLSQSLQDHDLGHLNIIAELWGFQLDAPDARVGVEVLSVKLLDQQLLSEEIADLPEDARMAIDDLLYNKGRLPWALFTRRYGTVREMGAARRDREQPYRNPISPAEVLWYRGLVARAFFDAPGGAKEFAYIPDDLLSLLPSHPAQALSPPGRPASLAERAHPILATDVILDHACKLLAGLRLGMPGEKVESLTLPWHTSAPAPSPLPLSHEALIALLSAANLLDTNQEPLPEPVRAFLEAGRGEALAQLFQAWLTSTSFNDLRLIPHLQAEGKWENNPLTTRQAILGFLASLPSDSWWSLKAFIAAVQEAHPDFQRPAGDYDSWFIRDRRSGEFLRGYEHWMDVDGMLIRFMISGPLHWLGVLDLASPTPLEAQSNLNGSVSDQYGGQVSAFRLSNWGKALLDGLVPAGLPPEDEAISVSSDARLRVPRLAPRPGRYLIARLCTWEGEKDGVYLYRVTPASLAHARQGGLTTGHLISLLRRQAQAVPPSLVKALERWETHGTEARFERVLVLRLSTPEMLQRLRSSRAARFLGDPLGPTTVIVKPGAASKVLSILAEMGYLGEAELVD